jgi:hypothetical protein
LGFPIFRDPLPLFSKEKFLVNVFFVTLFSHACSYNNCWWHIT